MDWVEHGRNGYCLCFLHRVFLIYLLKKKNIPEVRYQSFEYIIDSRHRVTKVKLYPKYQFSTRNDNHDVAILKLDRPVCKLKQPISLPWKGTIEETLVNDGDIPSRFHSYTIIVHCVMQKNETGYFKRNSGNT